MPFIGPRRLEFRQLQFQLGHLGDGGGYRGLRRLGLLDGTGHRGILVALQRLFLFDDADATGFYLLAQIRQAFLRQTDGFGGFGQPQGQQANLILQLLFIADQLVVQSFSLSFPFRLGLVLAPLDRGLTFLALVVFFLGDARDLLLCLLPSSEFRLPIHDEQHEDERTHRAEQHRQERKSRDFKMFAASSHSVSIPRNERSVSVLNPR